MAETDPSRAGGVEALAALDFFRAFPLPALEALAGVARWRRFEPGGVVLDAGEEARDVFFVAEGELRVVLRGAGGQEMVVNELGPGRIFGEIAAVDGGPRSAGVVALTPARVCAIAAGPFMDAALATPQVARQVMRLLAALVREKEERLREFAVLPVRARLIALLLRLARPQEGGGLAVSPLRPQHELAARIGTGREVVSRVLSALRREGLAAPGRGGLLLARPECLAAEVAAAYRAAGPA